MKKETAAALKIIQQANLLLIKNFQTLGLKKVQFKSNEEIVTNVDFLADQLITKKLIQMFPTDNIISEESEKINKKSEYTWYVDPLDGTTNYSLGLRDFSTCLALVKNKQIISGVIGIPLAKELYWAEQNTPAFLNGQPIHVSVAQKNRPRYMLLLCGGHSAAGQSNFKKVVAQLNPKIFRFRILSSAGIETTAVACGRADGFISPDIRPWDVLPGVLLVRAAGGRVTNFKGEEWGIEDKNIVASNGLIHKKLLELVK